MSSINFDNVYFLFIAVPIVLLTLVPFLVAVRRDNVNGHNVTSCILHLVMAIIIALTCAGVNIVTVVTETDVYVVADVSYSANKNLDLVDTYINNLKGDLPQNSRMGVIAFAKDYKLVTKLGETFKTVKGTTVDDSETNISDALEYAGSLFRDSVIKRIVLITDGSETETSSTSSNTLKHTVDTLVANDIYVDAIYLNDNITEATREVQVTDVDYTVTTYLNKSESVDATIQSNYNADVTVQLYKDGELYGTKVENLSSGSNTVSFDLYTEESGTFSYEVRVVADYDENDKNNSNYFTQTVSGNVEVLLISDSEDDYTSAKQLCGENANITAYINNYDVPCSVEELCFYDEIIVSNIEVTSLYNSENFVESLKTVVSAFGKSLLTFGDLGLQNLSSTSQDSDDEIKTSFSEMLPVKYGNSYAKEKLYTIVIDVSRSMETGNRLNVAKQAAVSLVGMLNDDDSVCIVYFSGTAMAISGPKKLSAYEDIVSDIENIDAAHGTSVYGGLNRALTEIKTQAQNYDENYVMLMSDGLSYTEEAEETQSIVNQLRAYNSVVSVLDVGRGSNTETEPIQYLQNIATWGAGEYYYVNATSSTANEQLQEVVFGELADSVTESKIDYASAVKIQKRYDEVLDEVGDKMVSLSKSNDLTIGNFIISKSVASATTVLTVEYQKMGESVDVPLFAYWNYGDGKVSTFTSGLSGTSVTQWKNIGVYEGFFGGVFTTSIPDSLNNYPYSVNVTRSSAYAYVEMTPATVRHDATMTISVTTPSGEVTESTLAFDSSVYSYGFTTPEIGKYNVLISYNYGGVDYPVCDASFTISYLPEYDSFATFDSSTLHTAVGTHGTVSDDADGKLEIVNDESKVGLRTVRLTVPLMIACVSLFAVDIIIRKLKWEDIVSLFKKVNKEKKAS
jgi:hypothetical protein